MASASIRSGGNGASIRNDGNGADHENGANCENGARNRHLPDVELGSLLDSFVRMHSGMRQRDDRWRAELGTTIGGSELAALMGMNPYSTFYDVLADKVAALGGGSTWSGGEACWWGTLFEDVIGAYVETDLGGAIKGDEICIRAFPGHRNSPDGFIVGRFYRDGDDRLCLWSTDLDPELPTVPLILLLEFKCPLTRRPKGLVPKQYRPQVWSGLAVSPVAHKGLYVDALFRKCAISDLGDSPAYDDSYHCRDKKDPPGDPVAWGLIGVYAPYLDAPLHVRRGWRGEEWAAADGDTEGPDADAAQAAWQIHSAYFGLRLKNQRRVQDLVDLGDAEARLFSRTLGLVDKKRFPVLRVAPCFADGRGHDLHGGGGFRDTIASLRLSAPDHHWLFAVLPWKLFEVAYLPVERRPGFMEEVMPLIEEVHRTVAEAKASGNPAAFLKGRRAQYAKNVKPVEGKTMVGEAALQDLFDSISQDAAPDGAT